MGALQAGRRTVQSSRSVFSVRRFGPPSQKGPRAQRCRLWAAGCGLRPRHWSEHAFPAPAALSSTFGQQWPAPRIWRASLNAYARSSDSSHFAGTLRSTPKRGSWRSTPHFMTQSIDGNGRRLQVFDSPFSERLRRASECANARRRWNSCVVGSPASAAFHFSAPRQNTLAGRAV